MNILKVEKLCKKVGKKEILKNVSFQIDEGDILAFIGPNGAGKTTTIKCILGLQRLTKGSITINGYDIKKDFVKAITHVGCLVESPDVYMYLTGMENLKIQAQMYFPIIFLCKKSLISLFHKLPKGHILNFYCSFSTVYHTFNKNHGNIKKNLSILFKRKIL